MMFLFAPEQNPCMCMFEIFPCVCTWCVCSRVNVTLSPECVIASVRPHSVILGLKRSDWPAARSPCLPQVKGQPALSIPPAMKKSLALPSPAHMLPDDHRGPWRPLNCVLHADRSSWCLRGAFLWDNWQLQRSPPDRPLSIQISTIDK